MVHVYKVSCSYELPLAVTRLFAIPDEEAEIVARKLLDEVFPACLSSSPSFLLFLLPRVPSTTQPSTGSQTFNVSFRGLRHLPPPFPFPNDSSSQFEKVQRLAVIENFMPGASLAENTTTSAKKFKNRRL